MDKSIKNIRIEKRFLSITALRIIINFLRGIKDTKKKKKFFPFPFDFLLFILVYPLGSSFLFLRKGSIVM